jgi:hypothetical protein
MPAKKEPKGAKKAKSAREGSALQLLIETVHVLKATGPRATREPRAIIGTPIRRTRFFRTDETPPSS